MARISVDDSIYRDPRFIKLVNITKDFYKALGLLVGAWSLAQKHYLNEANDRSIPLNEWEGTDFGPILESGLAKIIGNNVKLCGVDEQFSWLLQRSKAGKSTTPKKLDSLSKARLKRLQNSERNLNGIRTDSERTLNGSEPITTTITTTTTTNNINTNLLDESDKKALDEEKTIVSKEMPKINTSPSNCELNEQIYKKDFSKLKRFFIENSFSFGTNQISRVLYEFGSFDNFKNWFDENLDDEKLGNLKKVEVIRIMASRILKQIRE